MIIVGEKSRPGPWDGLQMKIDDDRAATTYYDGGGMFILEVTNGDQRHRLGLSREAAEALSGTLMAALEEWP